MRFDRSAPGEGAEVVCSLENGRAVLEWRFYFVDVADETGVPQRKNIGWNGCCGSKSAWTVRLVLTDMQGNMVLEGIQFLGEEEPLRSILMQPRLWRGLRDPYLYHLEVVLVDQDDNCQDSIVRFLSLRTFSGADSAGTFSLNGEIFDRRAVFYTPPFAMSKAETQRLVVEDFQQLLRLGANCIYMDSGKELKKLFLQFCDRLGFLLFYRENKEAVCAQAVGKDIRIPWDEEIPVFRGERDSFFLYGSKIPTSLFYQYMAKWSEETFAYLVPESVEKLEDGNYTVRCYSNCGKIALYSDGILFEVQKGYGEFLFQEIPVKTSSIMLTAAGDGCCVSLSLSRLLCCSPGKKRL